MCPTQHSRTIIVDADDTKASVEELGSKGALVVTGLDAVGNPTYSATEATLQKVAGFNIPKYDTQVINEADPNNVIITYKLLGVTVATKLISVAGSITTISVT